MNRNAKSVYLSTQYITRIGVMTALAVILFFVLEIPVFGSIYKLDFSNVPVLLASFSMGPVAGVITLALKVFIHLIIKGLGSTVGIGDLADFVCGLALILPASVIYTLRKNRANALMGMVIGTVAMGIAGVLMNWLVLFPFYMEAYHMDLVEIASNLKIGSTDMTGILFTATLPFNLLKGALISLIVFLIYKPLSSVLHVKKKQ